MNSGPREKPEEQQKAAPDSGTFKRDDSKSPGDEEVLRSPTPASLTPTPSEWLTPTPSGEKMVTKEETAPSSSRDTQTRGAIEDRRFARPMDG